MQQFYKQLQNKSEWDIANTTKRAHGCFTADLVMIIWEMSFIRQLLSFPSIAQTSSRALEKFCLWFSHHPGGDDSVQTVRHRSHWISPKMEHAGFMDGSMLDLWVVLLKGLDSWTPKGVWEGGSFEIQVHKSGWVLRSENSSAWSSLLYSVTFFPPWLSRTMPLKCKAGKQGQLPVKANEWAKKPGVNYALPHSLLFGTILACVLITFLSQEFASLYYFMLV